MEKYVKRGAIIKADDFVSSLFAIGELENKTLNYLRNFSREALKTFKQPFKMA